MKNLQEVKDALASGKDLWVGELQVGQVYFNVSDDTYVTFRVAESAISRSCLISNISIG